MSCISGPLRCVTMKSLPEVLTPQLGRKIHPIGFQLIE